MSRLIFCCFYVLLLSAQQAWGAEASKLPVRAQEVFDRTKDSVVQIRTLLKGSRSQNSIGSGFYVSSDGLLISNYHVVSSHAMQPDAYVLEYVDSNGQHGKLRLLMIDALHDLALLKREGAQLPFLQPDSVPPAKGEKLFSLGNPNDLGLSIVEGVNNGVREHSFYDLLHFTGAINGGMSGGPVVNQQGLLVGVNVASMGQSRGFLVPARFAAELLERWQKHPMVVPKFRTDIARQLKQHSAQLAARVATKSFPVQVDSGYSIPDAPDPYIRCWANEFNERKVFYRSHTYHCSGRSSIFVEDDIVLGDIFFSTHLYQTTRLDNLRFGRVLERAYAPDGEPSYEIPPEHFTSYQCQDSAVQLKGMEAKVALCVRAYRKYPGLYDLRLKVVTLSDKPHALVSRLNLIGVAYDDGMHIIKQYLGALQWKG